MKRPSGFDRAPDRGRDGEPGADEGGAPDPAAAGTRGGSEETAPARPSLLHRRLARRAEQDGAAGTGTDPGPGPGTGAAERGAAPAGEPAVAPTIDLSEVREARETGEAGGLGDAGNAGDVEPARGGELARTAPPSRFSLAGLRAARDADPVRAAERRLRDAERQHRARLRSERRRFSADTRRKRRNWIIALSAVAALALFVVAGAFTPVMAVRDLRVVGAVNVSQAEVEQALSRFDGRPLALVDDAEVHRALEPFPMIQHYAVERVPPHTLVVRIEERVPVVSVQGDAGYSVYDAAGVLLSTAEAPPAGAPLAAGAATDFASPAFRSAGRALRDMPAELRAQIVAVTASSAQDVTFTLASGIEVLWGDADRTRYKAEVLARMLAALADRGVEHIDVSSAEAPVFR